MALSLESIAIDQVVVPPLKVTDFTVDEPNKLPLELVRVQDPVVPPKVKVVVSLAKSVIVDLSLLKVEEALVKNVPLKEPAVRPEAFEAMTSSSPLDSVDASVTSVHSPVPPEDVTLTLHDAWKPPSSVVAVIVAVPLLAPVTVIVLFVVELIDAIALLLVVHLIVFIVALDGKTVAVKLVVSPIKIVSLVLLKLIPVASTSLGFLTLITQVAVY